MTFFVQNLVNALSLGSLYALLTLGIALVFGIMRLVNFAYGELLMAAGYAVFLAMGAPWPLVFAGAVATAAVCAIVMERVAFRPVRGAAPTTLLVTSFAVSYLLQHLALLIWGSRVKPLVYPRFVLESVQAGSFSISKIDIITIAATAILVASLAVFLKKSSIGVEMRAAADDFGMARFLGVRANAVIATAFLISGLIAGVVGVLYLAQVGTVGPMVGLAPLLVGVVAAVVGGLESLVGAALGGYFLGVVTIMLQAYLPINVAPFRDAFVFASVIVVLLVRPQGLLVAKSHAVRA